MNLLQRNLAVAVVAWAVWLALIAVRVRVADLPWVQVAFIVSLVPALAGCIRANAGLLAEYRGRRWRWLVIFAAGVAAFGLVLMVGHMLGIALTNWLQS